MDFNASYKCTTFDSTVGIRDDTCGTASATFALLSDGTQLAEASATIGRSAHITTDITGVFRVRLQTAFTFTNLGYSTWADTRVLCSAQPADSL